MYSLSACSNSPRVTHYQDNDFPRLHQSKDPRVLNIWLMRSSTLATTADNDAPNTSYDG